MRHPSGFGYITGGWPHVRACDRASSETSGQPRHEGANMSSISIIGSGNMARAIGALALKGGNSVEIASRDAAKAASLARVLGTRATAGVWGAAPSGDIVILAVLADGAVPAVREYGEALAG